MATENLSPYGIIGGVFFMMLNFLLGERKAEPRSEDDDDPGKISAHAVGAAFVDKSTADNITRIAADVATIKATIVENAEHDAERDLERRIEAATEGQIQRAIAQIRRGERHPGEND